MGTVTVSTRVAEEEAKKIDKLAAELGLERGSLLRQVIQRGCKEILTAKALEEYRKGNITLSRAAEMAEMSVRDLLLCLPEESLELSYDLTELERDLEA